MSLFCADGKKAQQQLGSKPRVVLLTKFTFPVKFSIKHESLNSFQQLSRVM
jgi:hypothetical protein